MSHIRVRYLTDYIKKCLKFSPLVGVLGQRQVGKTTLLQMIPNADYTTLDEDQTLQASEHRPDSFINSFENLTIIDECQKSPKIFPALKLRVQKKKNPGQFLLTGSVRFTSRKAIQESLTGRIVNLELLPLSLAESRHIPPLDFAIFTQADIKKINSQLITRQKNFPTEHISRFLKSGGLPGICFLRQESHRSNKFKSHIETLLQRDLQFIIQTTSPYTNLLSLLKYLAINQGEPFSLKEASLKTGLAQNTIKKLLDAYEGLFLIRRIKGLGFIKSSKFYLEDQGMAHYLLDEKDNHSKDLHRLMFSQIFANIHYTYNDNYEIGYYETKAGGKIDFVAKTEKQIYAFMYDEFESMTFSKLKIIDSFLKDFKNAHVIILTENKVATRIDKNIIRIPKYWII